MAAEFEALAAELGVSHSDLLRDMIGNELRRRKVSVHRIAQLKEEILNPPPMGSWLSARRRQQREMILRMEALNRLMQLLVEGAE
jgi:hypothetical protein